MLLLRQHQLRIDAPNCVTERADVADQRGQRRVHIRVLFAVGRIHRLLHKHAEWNASAKGRRALVNFRLVYYRCHDP